MTIDTGARTIRLQVQKQLFAILTGILFSLCYFPAPRDFIDTYFFSHYVFSVLLVVLYIFYQLYFWLRDISYVYATDELLAGMLCIRYFRILPFVSAKSAIELPSRELYKYEVESRWFGLREYVRIWQQHGRELYVFPPVSITLLRQGERRELLQLLDKYLVADDGLAAR